MTRQQFIDRYKFHVTGMALFGVVSELKDGPLQRAHNAIEMPAKVIELLGRMYDEITKEDKPIPAVGTNGTHQPQRTK